MAKRYPKTLLEFESRFRTEEACRAYLVGVRWPEGFHCPRCGHGQAWLTSRGHFHCGKCRSDTSVKAGTIFEGSHLPLRLWFRAIWWVTNQKGGMSALSLQRALGLGSYQSAWACLHKLRRAMVRPGREQLTGQIEVDESFVGGHEAGKGRRRAGKKSLVAVAAEIRGDGIGRIRLAQIQDTTERTLVGFVKQVAAPGAMIVTDGWQCYAGLPEAGYPHRPRKPQSHRSEIVALLPRVHRVSSLLKRWLLGVHQGAVSKRQLGHYLDEFTFRFNRRLSPHRGKLFHRLIEQAVAVPHVPYKSLIKTV